MPFSHNPVCESEGLLTLTKQKLCCALLSRDFARQYGYEHQPRQGKVPSLVVMMGLLTSTIQLAAVPQHSIQEVTQDAAMHL